MTPLERDSAALRPDETSVLLPVTGGLHTLVDRDIARKLEGTRLWLSGSGRRFPHAYVLLPKRFGRLYLHQFVLGRRPPLVIDHRSRNPLDNRRRNLRHVTRAVNQLNHGRSLHFGWRGVFRRGQAWHAHPSGQRLGPSHSVALLAVIERDEFIWRRHHVRDVLNFPHFVKRRDLPGFLQATGGRIFRVWFVRRGTGRLRVMTCRTVDAKLAIPRGTTAEPGLFDGLRFDPADRNLVAVFDMQACGYRFVPVEGVLAVACRGQRYRIIDPRPTRAGSGSLTRRGLQHDRVGGSRPTACMSLRAGRRPVRQSRTLRSAKACRVGSAHQSARGAKGLRNSPAAGGPKAENSRPHGPEQGRRVES